VLAAATLALAAATAATAAQPDFRQDFDAELVSGTVFVTLPDGRRVRLEDLLNIPAGSIIDARNGKMRLTVETKDGRLESSTWSEGIFKPVQLSSGLLECRLAGPLFEVEPTTASARGRPIALAARKRRRLWGNGSGKFRTRGRFGSATVRGTKWLTEDRPGLTLFLVRRGSVKVRDFVRHKTLILKKGERYIARKRKAQ
jgi:hypothetical protein